MLRLRRLLSSVAMQQLLIKALLFLLSCCRHLLLLLLLILMRISRSLRGWRFSLLWLWLYFLSSFQHSGGLNGSVHKSWLQFMADLLVSRSVAGVMLLWGVGLIGDLDKGRSFASSLMGRGLHFNYVLEIQNFHMHTSNCCLVLFSLPLQIQYPLSTKI